MKHNLAKVLGLEQYSQEPNIRVEPTEDEVIQIEADKLQQNMADYSQATTDALESIGNAQALASVISKSNTQDKTAYELLRVAVEQLKEKTGVTTTGVALESMDKLSYKTESLQDVKNFISRVWEAIKKAFFGLVDKVKAFVTTLLGRNKKVKEQVQEAEKKNEEYVKETKTAPVQSVPVATAQPTPQATKAEPKVDFKFSRKVADAIGTKQLEDFNVHYVSSKLKQLHSDLDSYVDSVIQLKLDVIAQEFTRASKAYMSEDGFVPPTWVSHFVEAKLDKTIGGDVGPSISIQIDTTGERSIKLSKEFVGNRQVAAVDPEELDKEIYRTLKKYVELSDRLIRNTSRYSASMGEFFKQEEALYNSIDAQDENSKAKLDMLKKSLSEFQMAVANLFKIIKALDDYILSIPDGFSAYTVENLNYHR